jgi:hypothetical protein
VHVNRAEIIHNRPNSGGVQRDPGVYFNSFVGK